MRLTREMVLNDHILMALKTTIEINHRDQLTEILSQEMSSDIVNGFHSCRYFLKIPRVVITGEPGEPWLISYVAEHHIMGKPKPYVIFTDYRLYDDKEEFCIVLKRHNLNYEDL